MSLIICSNKTDGHNPLDRFSEDQAPFRFRNHLTNTLKLAPNSEVAVQSVKVNKDGLMRLTRFDNWLQFFNQNLRTNADDPLINNSELSTGMPIVCSPDMIDANKPEYVNADEFVSRMTTGMKKGWPHPDMSEDNTKCQVVRAGGGIIGGGFEGFRMTYDYHSQPTVNLFDTVPANWGNLALTHGEASTMDIDVNGQDITCLTSAPNINAGHPTSDNHNVVWMQNYPMSHNQSELIYDLTGLKEGGTQKLNGGFALGLVRGVNNNFSIIPYCATTDELSAFPHHYDYVVYSDQVPTVSGSNFYLKVGHMVYDTDRNGGNARPCCMDEIMYWDNVAGDFPASIWKPPFVASQGRYNMSTNINEFDELRFRIANEIVSIDIRSNSGGGGAKAGTWYNITSYENRAGLGAPKMSVPKPAGQTCWNLYPKVMIRLAGRNTSLMTYQGKDNGHQTGAGMVDDRDWYVRQLKQGQIRRCMEIDTRHYNNLDSALYYVQKGCSGALGTSILTDYENITILAPDRTHYLGTEEANMQNRLGYIARAILDNSQAVRVLQAIAYVSDAVPEIMDFSSQFIRLDNWTQTTQNAGTGRPSKILYHMPRFDTSNREVGTGLYFEPHQRVYVKLNNTEPLHVNELQLTICDNKERLTEDLTGQTIICLHVQVSPTPLINYSTGYLIEDKKGE